MVARWAHNPKVTGSSPVPATKMKAIVDCFRRFMPFYVYILYSTKLDKTYVGSTSNLNARTISHNVSRKGWTVRGRPWVLIYFETFSSKTEAVKREKELKSGKGRVFIKDLILPKYLQS